MKGESEIRQSWSRGEQLFPSTFFRKMSAPLWGDFARPRLIPIDSDLSAGVASGMVIIVHALELYTSSALRSCVNE